MAGGIDNSYRMFMPFTSSRRRRNRNSTLLLLFHPVHYGGSVMNLTELMGLPGRKKDALGNRGLARINMRGNANIPDQIYFSHIL